MAGGWVSTVLEPQGVSLVIRCVYVLKLLRLTDIFTFPEKCVFDFFNPVCSLFVICQGDCTSLKQFPLRPFSPVLHEDNGKEFYAKLMLMFRMTWVAMCQVTTEKRYSCYHQNKNEHR